MINHNRIFRIVVLVIVSIFGSSFVFASHKDYSTQGGEFSVLKDIRLDVRKLSYFEKKSVSIEDIPLEASVFSCIAITTIQTKESYIGNYSVFEDLETEYQLRVGQDKDYALHNKLIDDIYQFWLNNPLDNSVIGDKNVTLRKGTQLIFAGRSYPNLVWFGNRFVQVRFIRFIDTKKSGFGAEQDFWNHKIRFYDGKTRVKPEFLENGLQSEFLRWYKDGKFQLQQQSVH